MADCRNPVPAGLPFYVELSKDNGSTWERHLKLEVDADDATSHVYAAKAFAPNEAVLVHIGDKVFLDTCTTRPRRFKNGNWNAFVNGMGYTRQEQMDDAVVRGLDGKLCVIDGGAPSGYVGMGACLLHTAQAGVNGDTPNLFLLENGIYIAMEHIPNGTELVKAD